MGTRDSIVATLRKPEGFKGHPLFADDRGVDPETDKSCQIIPDSADPMGLKYNLKITDFARCGVLKRNVSKRVYTVTLHIKRCLITGFRPRARMVPAISGRRHAV